MTVAEAKKQRAAAIKKKIQDDYQKNRDPIKEFFKLVSKGRFKLNRLSLVQTCQSVKINSPHMNLIALINSDMLYAKALEEQIPYFKFASWIESTVQKEVISNLFKSKKGAKSEIPADLITEDAKMTPRNKAKQASTKTN